MLAFVLIFFGCIGVIVGGPLLLPESSDNEVPTYEFLLVRRTQWGARLVKKMRPLRIPVPYVVIHHSHHPGACYNTAECQDAMRSIQNKHMDERGWWDIGYNFGLGSDGVAYEGRGWDVLGAHALHFNTVSIGICLIGDWSNSLPPVEQIKAAKTLIATGVELGYIKPNYKLVGHRQVRDTECPGDELYRHLRSWDHYVAFPATHKDLVDVEELPKSIKEMLRNESTTNE